MQLNSDPWHVGVDLITSLDGKTWKGRYRVTRPRCSVGSKGIFTPALFSSVELNPGAFTPLVKFVWGHINHTQVRTKTTGPRPCWRGGLGPVPNKLWYGSFMVRTWSNLDPTQLQQASVLNPKFPLDMCPLPYDPIRCFAPPSGNPRLRFESDMVQYGRQLASGGRGVSTIIKWSLATAVIGLYYKNTKCSRPKDQQKSLCLSLFWDLCAGVNTECFILKSNWLSYCCCFSAWLPVCLVPDSALLLPPWN